MIRIVAVMLIVTLAACGTAHVKPLDIGDAPDQTAIVSAPKNPWIGYYVTIESVDGLRVSRSAFRTVEVEVPHGPHVFEVSYIAGPESSIQNALVVLNAEAGHRYTIHANGLQEGFGHELLKGLIGGRGRWVAWIDDDTSHEVVAGQRPTGGMFDAHLSTPANSPVPTVTAGPLPPEKLHQ